jgi:CRISPR/Cas system-associated exonuclease Cas4 (RecB family)
MIINKKFDYTPLNRTDDNGTRKYETPDGKKLVSVTTVLSKTKDMTHLKEWVKRVGEVEANRIKTEASGIGNSMHKNLENFILGEAMTGSYLSKTLANVIVKKGLVKVDEIWGTEVGVYASGLYAGTTDLVGVHEGTPAIMDFKNSLKDKKKEWIEDYFMQLAAYAMAHNEMYGTEINKGVVMIATREAKYQEFIIEGSEFEHWKTKWAEKLCAYYERFE